MRIYFRANPNDRGDRSMFEGALECRIRLDGQNEDIVFQTLCEDKGIQEVTASLLNKVLNQAIDAGELVASQFEDYPDCPQGTESEYDAARAAATLAEDQEDDEPQEEDREEVDQVGDEEETVHTDEEDSDFQEEGQEEEAPIGEGEGAVTG